MLSEEELARRILDVIPAVMREAGLEMRRQTAAGFRMPHYHVLWLVARQPCTLSELAASQAVALPTMSRTVSTLVERKWVTRSRDPADRRRIRLEVTPEGWAVLQKLRRAAQTHLARRLRRLTTAEREKLLSGLDVLERVFAMEVDHGSH